MRCITLALLCVLLSGCNLPLDRLTDPAPPAPDPAEPVEPKPSNAEVYWEELAKFVEAGAVGNTDTLVLTCEQRLQKRGVISDLSRIDRYRTKRLEITEANRAEIASVLRGK